MLISITRHEIQKGKRNEKCECPVALALKREGFVRVRVERGFIVAWKELRKFQFDMPRDLIIDLWEYDSGGSLSPTTYQLVDAI